MTVGARLLLLFPLLAVVLLVGLQETEPGELVRTAWADGVRELGALVTTPLVAYPPHVAPVPADVAEARRGAPPQMAFLAIFLAGVLALPGTWANRGGRLLVGVLVLLALDAWRLVTLTRVATADPDVVKIVNAVFWPAPLVAALVLLLLAARSRPAARTA
ncbi:MAG: hypothetical protein AB7I45_01245 [Planctomycetota bacterium]